MDRDRTIHQSPATRRTLAGTLPASDQTARVATTPATLAVLARERVTISGRSWTVADLQARVARETER